MTAVTAGRRSLAITHHDGRYGALDNRCPHQGGPLGEGAIENGWPRCPVARLGHGRDDGGVGRHPRVRDGRPLAGPGATNLLTGLWDSKVDRAPILARPGIDLQVLGPGAFQEVDLRAAYGGVAAWGQTVDPESRHEELMALALKHAIHGRDVSHLVFPDGVQTRPAREGAVARGPEGRLAGPGIAPPSPSG